ncbi:hypothetical protein OEA41_006927 [Lepraria neglecta]|uniref:C2H2-type domain-containing protein n=1 Tax=Lepraria neglecta TaxID=209136 RepID=A0AAD9Z8W5_9LECA|nr:hypothetical protein OEA41_006927 [Lepraria neglecta]
MTTVSPQDISYSPGTATMRRGASGSSESSYSSRHYGSSTGTSPPAEFPDQQDYYPNDQQFLNCEVVDGGVYHSSNKATKSANRKSPKGGEGKLLHCISPQCEYKTERQFDLDRHMDTHFPPSVEKLLPCPGRGCGRTGEHGFKRKDHLTEHLRKVHAQHEKYPKTHRGGKRS